LLLTEDGDAWLVEASSGNMEGPFAVGSPPVDGPFATESGVRARFRNGSVAEWDTHLKPELSTGSDADLSPPGARAGEADARHGSASGLAVLRRRTDGGTHLDSPWTDWSIDIESEVYAVHTKGSETPSFTVRRSEDWSYLAWEAPHSSMPHGRLWISDGKGLRSFQP
jgi:hypothetical protein